MSETPPHTSPPGAAAASTKTWQESLGPLLLLAGIFLINFLSRVIFGPLLVVLERDLGLTHGEAGSLFLLITVGYSLSLAGSGFLTLRWSHRRIILMSALGLGLAQGLLALPQPLWTLRLGLLLLGLTAGVYLPSAMATMTSFVPPRHWGKAIAVHELAPNLGFVAAPFLAEIFLHWASWRALLLTLGGCSLIMAGAFQRWGKGGNFHGQAPTVSVLGNLLSRPSFWVMMVMFGLGIGTSFGIYAMLPLFLVSERGLERTWGNTLVALSRVAGMAVAFLAGWLVDRWGVRKSLTVFLGLTGLATITLGSLTGAALIPAVLVQSLLTVCFFPAGFKAVSLIGSAEQRNVAVSLTVPLGFLLGGGLIPALIGWAGDLGSFGAGIIATGLFTLLCLPLIHWLKPPAPAPQAP